MWHGFVTVSGTRVKSCAILRVFCPLRKSVRSRGSRARVRAGGGGVFPRRNDGGPRILGGPRGDRHPIPDERGGL